MSKAIIIQEGRNGYDVDAWKVIQRLVKPVLAQHIVDDGRLQAALEAIEQNFFTAFDQSSLDLVRNYPPESVSLKKETK